MAVSLPTTTAVAATSATTSSIDVAGIVSQLMQIEQQPVTLLQTQSASYTAKLSAVGTIQGALSTFQSTLQGLANPSTYQSLAATSSNTAIGVSASSNAVAGSYSVSVSQLAQSQSIVAAGQTSTTAAIGGGTATTLTFDFGTISGGTLSNGTYSGATFTTNGGGTKTVTIDSSNNSLAGIRDAINNANIGVTATIVNDGSAAPNRLVLTSQATGASNSMKISVSGDATLGSLLSYDPAGTQNLTQTLAAQSAQLSVNGISVSSSSNTVTGALQGVTLNLSGTTTSAATISVANDTASVTTAVNSLVQAYNALHSAIANVSSYDATTQTAGVLLGDPIINTIESQIHAALNQPITNNTSNYSSLSQIGITFQQDGTLAVDSTKLSSALSSNFSDIASLFSTVGKASDSLVSYSTAGSSTKPGSYAVNVTQLATQGNMTGGTALGATTTITQGSNDTLNLSVNGVSIAVVIPPGSYTASAMATELQNLINGSAAISGSGYSVSVAQNAGVLSLTSGKYGSASTVTLNGGNAAATLLGTPAQTAGLDVAGTINGASATGSGQYLTSTAGDSNGLMIQINGGATGGRGTITYSQGYAYTLNSLATSMLDPINGSIVTEQNGINSSITDINNQITDWQTRLASIQQTLTTQYSALDTMLGTMNQTSIYLTQQLARLP